MLARPSRVVPALALTLVLAAPARAQLAVIDTDLGAITVRLLPAKAPRHVRSVIELGRAGFYDGTTFHRTIPGYIIQGGSPTSRDDDPYNDNFGMPGFTLPAEFNDVTHERGVVSMARNIDEPDSAGSQFLIVLGAAPELDQIRHTAFGRVVAGMDIADRIAAAPRDEGNFDRPLNPVVIRTVRIVDEALVASATAKPAGTPAGTPAAPAARRLRITAALVNVRRGPGTDTAVAQKLPRGTVLRSPLRRGEWLAVELGDGSTGYVRQDMVETVE